MKRIGLLISILVLSLSIKAQESKYATIDTVVVQFYQMLATSNSDARNNEMANLFTPNGQISSVNHHTNQPAVVKSGPWRDFAAGSASLYSTFNIVNDEVERSVDYYQDIASVQGLVYQTLTDKRSGKNYAQLYWFQIELVFYNSRWYVDYASWTNQYQSTNVEEAVLTDTIWHQISH